MNLSKLHVSILALGPVLITLATLVWHLAGDSAKLEAVSAAHAETRQRVEKLEPAVQQLTTGQAVMQQMLQEQGKGIDRLERKAGTKP